MIANHEVPICKIKAHCTNYSQDSRNLFCLPITSSDTVQIVLGGNAIFNTGKPIVKDGSLDLSRTMNRGSFCKMNRLGAE